MTTQRFDPVPGLRACRKSQEPAAYELARASPGRYSRYEMSVAADSLPSNR